MQINTNESAIARRIIIFHLIMIEINSAWVIEKKKKKHFNHNSMLIYSSVVAYSLNV